MYENLSPIRCPAFDKERNYCKAKDEYCPFIILRDGDCGQYEMIKKGERVTTSGTTSKLVQEVLEFGR